MSFETYEILAKLKLLDGVSLPLFSLSKQFSGFNTHLAIANKGLTEMEVRMKRMKDLGVGLGLAGAGAAGLMAFKKPLEDAAAFNQQVAKFSLFGLGDKVNAEAVKFAKGMNVIGTSTTDAMRYVAQAQGVFREGGLKGLDALKGAELAAPYLAKMAFATQSLDDETKARYAASGNSMMRFVEQMGGVNDPNVFKGLANQGWKAIQSSGANVNWEMLRQAAAFGGPAVQFQSPESLLGAFEPTIGALKGGQFGTGMYTAYRRLTGAVRVPNQIAHEFVTAGLWDPKKIEWNKMGGIKRFKGNPLSDADSKLLTTHADQFYEQRLLPYYARLGLKDTSARARENSLLLGNTGGKVFTMYDKTMPAAHLSIAAQAKALGLDQSVAVAAKTMQGKQIDLQAKWNSLMTDLGMNVLPMAIKGLSGLTDSIRTLTDAAGRHPTATTGIEYGLLGLSGLSLAGGALKLGKWLLGGMGLGRGALWAGRGLLAAGGVAGGAVTLPEILIGAGIMGAGYGLFKGSEKAWDWYEHRGDHGPMGGRPKISITVVNKIDKNGLSTAVLDDLGRQMHSPQTGVSFFDDRQGLLPAGGASGSW